jgi:hypothetical protein
MQLMVGCCEAPVVAPPISKLLAVFNISQTKSGNWIKHTKDRPFSDRRYAIDGTKLHQLGWKQKITFEEGLKITVDWYRDFPADWAHHKRAHTIPCDHGTERGSWGSAYQGRVPSSEDYRCKRLEEQSRTNRYEEKKG